MAQFPITPKPENEKPDVLAWTQDDIENRFGFKGARYTSVNHGFAFLIGAMLAGILYALMIFVLIHVPIASKVATMFMRPTNQFAVIPATVFFFWGVAILILKGKKVQFQERALQLSAVPAQPEFILTETTAVTVLARIHALVDNPRHFMLLNRIDRALSNFKNIGQVNDVSSILRAQAENDEDQVASSYVDPAERLKFLNAQLAAVQARKLELQNGLTAADENNKRLNLHLTSQFLPPTATK